ncbi:Tlr 6Fp protein [Tupanvirus deep ocean]|uniref:Tlr 6Fp protein n=2 Tax=Tupanvirus TaxID=2094720 RepID=A0AC62A9P5_9VIRU|nr:Tlr 6Fp protein [Tupanvirus deep ocean]QKU34501.1 Tlr 6Fp protein [Tupanvirus deep ocean]
MTYHIYPSNRRDKKFYVYNGRKKIYFGATGYEDYTTHKDNKRKQRYNSRHRVRENWRDPGTAGFWSKWILWNKPSLQQSVVDTKKRFGIDIVLH